MSQKNKSKIIDHTLENSTQSPENILDCILFNTSTIAKEYISVTKARNLAERCFLVNEIRVYENYVYNHPDRNPEDVVTLDNLKADLDELNLQENFENIKREQAADLSNPQRPSRDFKPPPSNAKKKITEIFSETDPDHLITNQSQAEEIYKFFKKIYKQGPQSDNFSEFVDFSLPQVTPQKNSELTKIVTTAEIAKFIKHTNHNKAPGLTGETTPFFKCFWVKLKDLVTNALNNVLQIKNYPKDRKLA